MTDSWVGTELDELRARFFLSNWPLVGDLRSYIFFKIHNVCMKYAEAADSRSRESILSTFYGFSLSLEATEALCPMEKCCEILFKDLETAGALERFPHYIEMKQDLLRLSGYLSELKSSRGWAEQKVEDNYLLIIGAGDEHIDDFEMIAESYGEAKSFRSLMYPLAFLRDEVHWSGAGATNAKNYLTMARRIVQTDSYGHFRHDSTYAGTRVSVPELMKELDVLENELEVAHLWELSKNS